MVSCLLDTAAVIRDGSINSIRSFKRLLDGDCGSHPVNSRSWKKPLLGIGNQYHANR